MATGLEGMERGAAIRWWSPRHAEHGMQGHFDRLDAGLVHSLDGWRCGRWVVWGPLLAERVVTEAEYQARKAADPLGWLWPD